QMKLLAQALGCVEKRSPFKSARLAALSNELHADGLPPSRQVARMDRYLDMLDWQRNQFFAPLAIVLLWEIHLAIALEMWRQRSGGSIRKWISVVGEFEALSSLATYAFEHPADPFPELFAEGARFEARELGHPLIPNSTIVRNDVNLDSQTRL